MIVVKNEELAIQFSSSFLLMNKIIMVEDVCFIKDNTFFLICNETSEIIEIDLDRAEIKKYKGEVSKLKRDSCKEIYKGEFAWSMCNMVNNALQQWTGYTPFYGDDVCNNLSRQATEALKQYGISLELSLRHMKVFKSNRQITYEAAIADVMHILNTDEKPLVKGDVSNNNSDNIKTERKFKINSVVKDSYLNRKRVKLCCENKQKLLNISGCEVKLFNNSNMLITICRVNSTDVINEELILGLWYDEKINYNGVFYVETLLNVVER